MFILHFMLQSNKPDHYVLFIDLDCSLCVYKLWCNSYILGLLQEEKKRQCVWINFSKNKNN